MMCPGRGRNATTAAVCSIIRRRASRPGLGLVVAVEVTVWVLSGVATGFQAWWQMVLYSPSAIVIQYSKALAEGRRVRLDAGDF